MPDHEDYRLYLEEKFKGLTQAQHAYFREVHDSLDVIKKETSKTNSRVNGIEDEIECINKDLTEYRFVKRHPNIMITIIAVAVIGIVFGLYKTFNSFTGKVNEVEEKITNEIRLMDGVSKETRGYVKYRDEMGFTDSVKVQ